MKKRDLTVWSEHNREERTLRLMENMNKLRTGDLEKDVEINLDCCLRVVG